MDSTIIGALIAAIATVLAAIIALERRRSREPAAGAEEENVGSLPSPKQPLLQDGFMFGDYATQLGDKSLTEDKPQRLLRLIEALDRLPPTWRNEILADYLSHSDFQRLVDSLNHSAPDRLVRATLLGSSHRSVCNEIQRQLCT